MTTCLAISHGQIAQAFLEAAKQITGECSDIYSLNCDGGTPRALYDKITHLIESENLKDGLFILVSLRGGSCWNAAAKVAKEYEKVELISGLNLSIVLSFITKREHCGFKELAEVLLKDGVRGISRLN
ncbi:MAG: PTS sugar transporter subunit IIA [Caldithrix sp.]|nr:MAG: PTS sugar transporter subunit IIA [Caldithrix sp.]